MSRRPKPQPNRAPLLLPSQRAKQTDAVPPHGGHTAQRESDGDIRHGEYAPQVTRNTTDKALPLGSGVRLVAWHPCGLYVLDKPEGVLSHPNKKAEIDRSLLRAPYSLEHEYFYNLHAQAEPAVHQQSAAHTQDNAEGEASAASALPEKLYLLHRLDSATSGLLLLADNEALANSVRAAFAEGGVRKTYFALCAATTPVRAGEKGRWSDRLQREHSGAGGGIVHVRASNSGLSAVTDFLCRKTAARNNSLALLELHPISGRTHQLRVHCAQHGLPIIGDSKYGDFRLNRAIAKSSGHKRLFLHAAALALNFSHQGTAMRMQFTAPLPPEFDALLHEAPELNTGSTATSGHKRSGSGRAHSGRTGKSGSYGDKNAADSRKPKGHSRSAPQKGGGTSRKPSAKQNTGKHRRG